MSTDLAHQQELSEFISSDGSFALQILLLHIIEKGFCSAKFTQQICYNCPFTTTHIATTTRYRPDSYLIWGIRRSFLLVLLLIMTFIVSASILIPVIIGMLWELKARVGLWRFIAAIIILALSIGTII